MAVIKSIASVESIASENVIELPLTVYEEFGACITPLNETINCNYAYLAFKGILKTKNFKYSSRIISSSLGINE